MLMQCHLRGMGQLLMVAYSRQRRHSCFILRNLKAQMRRVGWKSFLITEGTPTRPEVGSEMRSCARKRSEEPVPTCLVCVQREKTQSQSWPWSCHHSPA